MVGAIMATPPPCGHWPARRESPAQAQLRLTYPSGGVDRPPGPSVNRDCASPMAGGQPWQLLRERPPRATGLVANSRRTVSAMFTSPPPPPVSTRERTDRLSTPPDEQPPPRAPARSAAG